MATRLTEIDWDRLRDEIQTGLRDMFRAAFDAVDELPNQLDKWARDRHRPVQMDETTAWCFTCRQTWPCDEFVQLDARIASRSGEQPPPPPPGSAGSGGGTDEEAE